MDWKKILLGKFDYSKTTESGKYDLNINIQGGIFSVAIIIVLIVWLIKIIWLVMSFEDSVRQIIMGGLSI